VGVGVDPEGPRSRGTSAGLKALAGLGCGESESLVVTGDYPMPRSRATTSYGDIVSWLFHGGAFGCGNTCPESWTVRSTGTLGASEMTRDRTLELSGEAQRGTPSIPVGYCSSSSPRS